MSRPFSTCGRPTTETQSVELGQRGLFFVIFIINFLGLSSTSTFDVPRIHIGLQPTVSFRTEYS